MALSAEKTEARKTAWPRGRADGVALMPQALGDDGSFVRRLVAVGRRAVLVVYRRKSSSFRYRGGPKLKDFFQVLEASIPRFCRP